MQTRTDCQSVTPRSEWAAWLSCLAIGLVGLLTLGCERKRYEIELTPDRDLMNRDLTVWREKPSGGKTEIIAFPDEDLERLADAYAQREPEAEGEKRRFSGRFRDAVPQDVGGAGWYLPLESPMGTVAGYVERVRGNDDLSGEISKRLTAADALVSVVMEWLESTIGNQDGFAELRTAIDTNIRGDLRNLCVYGFAFGIVAERQETNEECAVRVGQYLVERAYFQPKEIPRFIRAFNDANRDKPRAMIAVVKRMLARKMGIADDAPIPEILHIFDDPVRMRASMEKYLATTDHYKKLVEKWRMEKDAGKTGQNKMPQPMDVTAELAVRAFLPSFSLGSDQLTVQLNVPAKPFSTNGKWDDKTSRVTWSGPMHSADHSQRPLLLFAFWAIPDTDFQEKHFGKALLTDLELSNYCLWYQGLGKSEVEQWDQFVARLAPGNDLVDRLRRFAFKGETRPTEDSPKGLADDIKQMLISRLENKGVRPL